MSVSVSVGEDLSESSTERQAVQADGLYLGMRDRDDFFPCIQAP